MLDFSSLEKDQIMVISQKKEDIMKPSELFEKMKQYVVGQDEALKALCVTFINYIHLHKYNVDNYHLGDILKLPNLFLMGDTGSGKTYMIQTAAKLLNIPILCIDLTHYSPSGYKGKEVSTIISDYINMVNGEIFEKKGIIYVDEMDKILLDASNKGWIDQIQKELLKFVEGSSNALVDVGSGNREVNEIVDTRNIFWIFSGACSQMLEAEDKKRSVKESFGIVNKVPESKNLEIDQALLVKFGFLREMAGRIQKVIRINKLSDADFFNILKFSKDSPLEHYRKLGELRGIELKLTKAQLQKIIEKARELGTGARGLQGLIDKELEGKLFT